MHVDLAELLHHLHDLFFLYLQQSPFATGAGAGAAELDRLRIEHSHLVLVVEAVEDLFRFQTEQLFILDGAGELGQVFEIVAVILALGGQLLQQDAGGARLTLVVAGADPQLGRQLFGLGSSAPGSQPGCRRPAL